MSWICWKQNIKCCEYVIFSVNAGIFGICGKPPWSLLVHFLLGIWAPSYFFGGGFQPESRWITPLIYLGMGIPFLFPIAFRTNFFVVYHFRYPHMTKNGPQNGQKAFIRISTKSCHSVPAKAFLFVIAFRANFFSLPFSPPSYLWPKMEFRIAKKH